MKQEQDTSEEEIVSAILDEYEVESSVAAGVVERFINKLREYGFLA